MTQIKENIEKLQNKINLLANKFNRNPHDIKLVAVSKYQPISSIEEAYSCGLRDFGENYIQEWQKKAEQLSHLKDIRWHIIGNLQKNKVKFLTQDVFCFQSLNSLALAKEIEKKWGEKSPLDVHIQLQVDCNDTNKRGVSLENAKELCEFVLQSRRLNLLGFMGIGPDLKNNEKLKALYCDFVAYCHKLWISYPQNESKKIILSLGMSQDIEIALECGSNMVRVGTALFGDRPIEGSVANI